MEEVDIMSNVFGKSFDELAKIIAQEGGQAPAQPAQPTSPKPATPKPAQPVQSGESKKHSNK
jgi:hypothetical protein